MKRNWPDELTERLIRIYHADDHPSASEIAARLGEGITRNMVCGKVHRMGLTRRGVDDVVRAKRRDRANANSRKFKTELRPKPARKAMQFIPQVEACDVIPRRVALEDLRFGDCRAPYGDSAPFTFCGHRKIEGSSYCAAHFRLCWQPARDKWSKAA